jgi:hypothetical protein
MALTTPCPAHLVPDATGLDAFNAAYKAAKTAAAVFIGVERCGRRWTVKADTLTAGPRHLVDDATMAAVRAAAVRLARSGEIAADSVSGPVHYTLRGVREEERARELAAALHRALYGDVELLERAVAPRP